MRNHNTINQIRNAVRQDIAYLSAVADWLWHHPETGFREIKTTAYLVQELEALGLSVTTWPDMTGFMAELETGNPGPCICLMSELDSVVCWEHPNHDPETGAAHACGHHVQSVAVLGAVRALLSVGVLPQLCGKIRIIGVPAEECLQLDWRMSQIAEGRLHYLSGKAEMISRGVFDDVDVVISIHASCTPKREIRLMGTNNGFLAKSVSFQGRAAHAAASPDTGINALYMANTALTALNGIRETFRDRDTVRIHPIITKGGSIVNSIPEEVCLECLCRAANMDTVLEAGDKFDRAMGAGAYAFGGKAVIRTQPGYFPGIVIPALWEVALDAAADCVNDPSEIDRGESTHETSSSDLGDLQSVLPAIQCYTGFATGSLHAANWHVVSEDAYALPAEFLAAFAIKLLEHDGAAAKKIRDTFKPRFTTSEAYCEFCNRLFSSKVLP